MGTGTIDAVGTGAVGTGKGVMDVTVGDTTSLTVEAMVGMAVTVAGVGGTGGVKVGIAFGVAVTGVSV